MNASPPTPSTRPADGRERRRERRYEVELRGELHLGGEAVPVTIADLSASGALLYMNDPPPAGTEAQLWIEDFGIVDVEIVHSGETFCGLTLIDPAAHRDHLLEWLREEVPVAATT